QQQADRERQKERRDLAALEPVCGRDHWPLSRNVLYRSACDALTATDADARPNTAGARGSGTSIAISISTDDPGSRQESGVGRQLIATSARSSRTPWSCIES